MAEELVPIQENDCDEKQLRSVALFSCCRLPAHHPQGGIAKNKNQYAAKLRQAGAELSREKLYHLGKEIDSEKLKQPFSELMRLKLQRVVGEKSNDNINKNPA